jgi:hypothetical protein
MANCKGVYNHSSFIVIPGMLVVRVTSKNRPGFYWAIDEGVEGYLMREAELFKVTVVQNCFLRHLQIIYSVCH